MKRLAVTAIVTSTLIFLIGSSASRADHPWANYHWERSSNPVTVELGDNVEGHWKAWLGEAATDWSASAVLETPVATGQAKGKCRPNTGRVEVCNDAYGANGWLGLAQIWVSGDHIGKAVAKVNDTYHDTYPYNQDGWRDLVMCQEVGHAFGLGHQDEIFDNGNLGTCMDYTSTPDGSPANRAPNAHDYEVLADLYSHMDPAEGTEEPKGCKGPAWRCAGAKPTSPPAFDMDLESPGQWGRLISTSRDGGQSTFVQDFGNGLRVFTHVTWTLDVAADLTRPHDDH